MLSHVISELSTIMGKKESEIEGKRKEKLHLYVNHVPKTKRKKEEEKKDRKNNLQYQKKKKITF